MHIATLAISLSLLMTYGRLSRSHPPASLNLNPLYDILCIPIVINYLIVESPIEFKDDDLSLYRVYLFIFPFSLYNSFLNRIGKMRNLYFAARLDRKNINNLTSRLN